MNEYEFSVSLRVMHPKIDPEEITRALGVNPSRKWKIGVPRNTPKGTILPGINKETYWSARLHGGARLHSVDISLEDFIAETNHRLRSYEEYFGELSNGGGHIEYFIGWYGLSNIGATFKPSVLKRTAELNIAIALDVYPGD